MNTKEAYAKFLAGYRVGVIVTNADTGASSIHEITQSGWVYRMQHVPHNTNYVILGGNSETTAPNRIG